jgi:hypothetical protein
MSLLTTPVVPGAGAPDAPLFTISGIDQHDARQIIHGAHQLMAPAAESSARGLFARLDDMYQMPGILLDEAIEKKFGADQSARRDDDLLARLRDETFDLQTATPIAEMFGLPSIKQLLATKPTNRKALGVPIEKKTGADLKRYLEAQDLPVTGSVAALRERAAVFEASQGGEEAREQARELAARQEAEHRAHRKSLPSRKLAHRKSLPGQKPEHRKI